jgi:aminopeptidase YwaD
VIGVLPGRRPGAVVVGAHFDSVAGGPGANDNASGTATMLEVARFFAQRDDYPDTLYFVAFGAEELGLRGSRHFVESLPQSVRQELRAMLNLDMVGVGDEQRLVGATELVEIARDVAEAMGIPNYVAGGSSSASSDHESFQRVGLPALLIHRRHDPNYHTPRDLAEYVDPTYLALAGQLAINVLERLAAEPQ